jgi:hypothetical protein
VCVPVCVYARACEFLVQCGRMEFVVLHWVGWCVCVCVCVCARAHVGT